jgi:hypothetical protein
MKIKDEAEEFSRKQRAAQKKQRYRMRRKGRTADQGGGNKPRLIQIWVNDPEAWRAIHGVSEPTSLVAITEAHIIKQCRRYRKMEVEQAWGSIGRDYVFEDEAPKPLPPRTTPNVMTEEQEEIAGDDGVVFIEGDDGRGLHPTTWGGRRVRTSRNHKRGR